MGISLLLVADGVVTHQFVARDALDHPNKSGGDMIGKGLATNKSCHPRACPEGPF